jgi:hypothetical protein
MDFIHYFERIWVIYLESHSAILARYTARGCDVRGADVRNLQCIPFVGRVVPTPRYCGEGVHAVFRRMVPIPPTGLCIGGYRGVKGRYLNLDTSHCALLRIENAISLHVGGLKAVVGLRCGRTEAVANGAPECHDAWEALRARAET